MGFRILRHDAKRCGEHSGLLTAPTHLTHWAPYLVGASEPCHSWDSVSVLDKLFPSYTNPAVMGLWKGWTFWLTETLEGVSIERKGHKHSWELNLKPVQLLQDFSSLLWCSKVDKNAMPTLQTWGQFYIHKNYNFSVPQGPRQLGMLLY